MSESVQNPTPPKKKSGRCCLWVILIPLLTILCLVSAYFVVPRITSWLGIFGMEAREVYEAAPDLAASASLTETFTELGIPGVRVYVIPIKDEQTQGAFVILDISAGYQGMDPMNSEDDMLRIILEDITRRNRSEKLNLAHVTVEYRDEAGEPATAFTVDQETVEQYADGLISRREFFAETELDLLGTMDYLGIEDLLEEIQE